MSTPSAYPIRIFIAGNEATDFAPFDKLELEDNRKTVSRFTMLLENPDFTPEKGMVVYIYTPSTGETVFSGYVVDLEERKHDNGIVKDYALDCADKKIRLQKAVVPFDDYSGSDSDIIGDIFENAHPDITGDFDFSSGVNSIANDLDLSINDDNLLDALEKLSKQAGSDYSYNKGGANQRIQFSDNLDAIRFADDYPSAPVFYTYGDSAGFVELGRVPGGQPGNCLKWTATTLNTAIPDQVTLTIAFGGSYTVSNVVFDVYFNFGTSSLNITKTGGGGTYNTSVMNVWQTVNWHTVMSGAGLPFTGPVITLTFRPNSNAVGSFEIRLDNIRIFTTEPFVTDSTEADELVWDNSPEPSGFDLDIQTGNEFGANIDLNVGGWDDYNSVIVIGAAENVPVSWTYYGNEYQDHYPLEAPIKDIVVEKNTGSDVSPTWGSALALGKWGVDERTVDGGSKDVLYDEAYHWLYFNTAPSTLHRAFRVTGTIKKPIRVLVENYNEGDVVYATTVYAEDATTAEAAINAGFAALGQHSEIRQLDFKTLHPGLKVGQSVLVEDSARGLSEQITIQRITVKWIGASGHAEFFVECGNDEQSGADAGTLIANNDKRSRKKAAPAPISTIEVSLLTDRNGNVLTDRNGSQLYQVN